MMRNTQYVDWSRLRQKPSCHSVQSWPGKLDTDLAAAAGNIALGAIADNTCACWHWNGDRSLSSLFSNFVLDEYHPN